MDWECNLYKAKQNRKGGELTVRNLNLNLNLLGGKGRDLKIHGGDWGLAIRTVAINELSITGPGGQE